MDDERTDREGGGRRRYVPAIVQKWLADLDKKIAEMKSLVNAPLGDDEQRLARIQLHFLEQLACC
jgi:hypothetical protein